MAKMVKTVKMVKLTTAATTTGNENDNGDNEAINGGEGVYLSSNPETQILHWQKQAIFVHDVSTLQAVHSTNYTGKYRGGRFEADSH